MNIKEMAVKKKVGSKWHDVPMPKVEEISVKKHLKPLLTENICLHYVDNHHDLYVYSSDEIKHFVAGKGQLMDFESFCYFWQYKLLEFGVDEFTKMDNYKERQAIMMIEGQTQEDVDNYTKTRPELYPAVQDSFVFPDDF